MYLNTIIFTLQWWFYELFFLCIYGWTCFVWHLSAKQTIRCPNSFMSVSEMSPDHQITHLFVHNNPFSPWNLCRLFFKAFTKSLTSSCSPAAASMLSLHPSSRPSPPATPTARPPCPCCTPPWGSLCWGWWSAAPTRRRWPLWKMASERLLQSFRRMWVCYCVCVCAALID